MPPGGAPDATPEVFHALADPVRRRLVELLAPGPRTPRDLARRLALSRGVIGHHLRVLSAAGLVRQGRRRAASARPEALASLRRYFDSALTVAAITSAPQSKVLRP